MRNLIRDRVSPGCRIGTIRDLSSEGKQLQLLKWFESALKHASDSILISDKDGIITFVNEQFCNLFGYSFDIVGNSCEKFYTDINSCYVWPSIYKSVNEGKIWKGEIYLKRGDGKNILSAVNIFGIKNGRPDQPSYYMAIIRNSHYDNF